MAKLLVVAVALILASASSAVGATWYVKSGGASTTSPADSCASGDVQAAITAASAGDTIQIGAGSCTWTVPVTTMYSAGSPAYSGSGISKWLTIQGAGTIPTHGAATSGGTAITDHVVGGGPYYNLLLSRESPDGNVVIANLTVNLVDGYSKASVIGWELGPTAVGTPGAKVIVMHHMTFNDDRTSATPEAQISRIATGRGLIYRNRFVRPYVLNNFAVYRCLIAGSHAFWKSAHTLGAADTGGDMNLYFEDNIVLNYSETSVDSGCRSVFAFNDLTNTGLTGHGLDSQTPGARQFVTFGNNFNCSGSTAVMNTPVALRGAVQIHHDNRFDVFDTRCTPNATTGHMSTGVYIIRDRSGTGCYRKSDGTPGDYPAPNQFGWGYISGATSVDRWYYDEASPSTHIAQDADGPYLQDLQPSYVWGQYLKDGTTKTYDGSANNGGFGLADFSPDSCSSGQASSNFIVENREWYKQNDAFNGTVGVGIGARASRPATCTTGTAWWATDQGSTMTSATTGLSVTGVLDICTATNTWTNASYTPQTHPHPLATVVGSDSAPGRHPRRGMPGI